jgi:hypothetical protein
MTTALCGVSGVDPAYVTPSSFSLGVKYVQEPSPTRVQNALAQSSVLDHTGDVEVFHHNQRIQQGVVMGNLEVKITSLALNLQVRLCHTSGGFLASSAAFLAAAQRLLFASQCLLRCTEEAWIWDGIAVTVGQEGREPNINPDSWSIIFCCCNINTRRCLTHNQRIPVTIGTIDQIDRLGRAFKRTVQLDLDASTKLFWHNQMPTIDSHITTSTPLSKLKGVPLVWLLEPRESNAWTTIRLSLMSMVPKELQRLVEPVSNCLQRGCWRVCTSGSRKDFIQIVSVRKRLRLTVVFLRVFQHRVVCVTCFSQALAQTTLLIVGGIQSILKRFHISNYDILEK